MQPHEVRLVRESFAAVGAASDAVATNFYQRLFRRAPEVRALFPAGMAAQRAKLMETLAVIVEALDDGPHLAVLAGGLGRSHQAYRVREEHYAPVGEALVAALRDHLGPRFTPDMDAAWRQAYAALADLMIRGQREAA